MTKIIPAIFPKNLAQLHDQLEQLKGWAPAAHIDLTDDHFVDGRTIELPDTSTEISQTTIPLIAHLMVDKPEQQVRLALDLGYQGVLVHWESLPMPEKFVEAAFTEQLPVGVVVNPDTKLEDLIPVAPHIQEIMIMGVVPGAQGREFLPDTLNRLKQAKELFKNALVEVDGGMNENTIAQVAKIGIDRIVSGSAIWKNGDPKENYEKLSRLVN